MIEILVSVLVFMLFVMFHVGIHRLLELRNIHTFGSTSIFGIGLLVLGYLIMYVTPGIRFGGPSIMAIHLPATAILLYVLASGVQVIFFVSPFLGQMSPSAKILSYVRNNKNVKRRDVIGQFTYQELIGGRLDDLIGADIVVLTKKHYTITAHGWKTVKLLWWYQRLTGWESSG